MNTDEQASDNIPEPAIIAKSHRAVVYCYAALLAVFALYGLWQLFNGGNAVAIVVLWLIKSVPLAIFIPGLRARKLRTYAWLSFVSLLYFVQSVQTAFTVDARAYGVLVTLLVATLFCALVVYIRSYRGHYKVSF
jgi:uncharacterized membrane protein